MRHRDADLATDRRPGWAGVAPHEITVLISDLRSDLLPVNLQGVTHHPPHLLPHLAGVTHVRTLVTPVWTILEISIKLTLPLSAGVIQEIQKTNKMLLFFIYCLKKVHLFIFIYNQFGVGATERNWAELFSVKLIRITGWMNLILPNPLIDWGVGFTWEFPISLFVSLPSLRHRARSSPHRRAALCRRTLRACTSGWLCPPPSLSSLSSSLSPVHHQPLATVDLVPTVQTV